MSPEAATAPDPALAEADEAVLEASIAHCRHVTRREAGNFYHGLRLTPEPKRSAMYAVYAYMRACDDLADAAGPEKGPERVEAFRRETDRVLEGGAWPDRDPAASFWPAFRWAARAYGIDRGALHAMLDGQIEDLAGTTYETFDELRRYCYRVAGTVGLVCLDVWGYEGGEATRQLAVERGVALQLTNILRDVAEDAARGRVYLPREDLERFGCDLEGAIRAGGDAAFDALMGFEIERARRHYEAAAELEARLPRETRPTAWALAEIYRRLLERIAHAPRRVLRGRARLSRMTKTGIALRALAERVRGPRGRGRGA